MTKEQFIRGLQNEYGQQTRSVDETEACGPLLRKNAACIVHEFLRDELREPDEIDVSEAVKLRDLFDCRVCAGHVMQVYAKGIMEGHKTAEGHLVFGMDEEVSEEEALGIRERVFYKDLRKPKQARNGETVLNAPAVCIGMEEVQWLCKIKPHPILVDVRTAREYDAGHLKGAVHIPLMELLKNPYAVSVYRDDRVLVYCAKGHQSQIAAQCLLEAGYGNVSYFAWTKEE